MVIRNAKDTTLTRTEHGEIISELLGVSGGGTQQHSVAQITLASGKASRPHYHPVAEESYYILKGKARVVINDEVSYCEKGDTIAIPSGVVHQIFNDSDQDLVFLAICVPPWTPECSVYVD